MTEIKFDCPHCGQSMEAPPEMLGDMVDCPFCSKSIVVSSSEQEPSKTPPLLNRQNAVKPIQDKCSAFEWHYASGEKRIGPVSEEVIKQLIEIGTITRGMLVWRKGMPSWLPIENSELSGPIPEQSALQPLHFSNTPPPPQTYDAPVYENKGSFLK